MNQVTVTMTAEDARAVAAWRRQQQLTEQYLQNLKRINEESKKGEGSLAGMVSKGTAELAKFAVAATGIGSAIAGVMAIANQLKREYENMVAKQRGARDGQLGIAEAQREASKALLAGDKTLSLDGLQERVASISKSTGADQAAIYNAVASALGAKPAGVTDKEVLDAAEVAAKLSPTNSAALETNLSAFMFQKAATGGSFEDIAGYQLRLKALSPTKSEESFARNIAPAIGKGKAFGTDADEQSGLLAYFGQQMGDTEGMVTANAVTNFEKQIFEATAGKVEGGTIARLKYLQTEEGKKKRNKFLGPLGDAAKKGKDGAAFGIVGEAKAFTTMLGLIEGGDIGKLEDTVKAVGTTAGSAGFFEDTISQVDNLDLQKNARADRMISTGLQNIQVKDIDAARGTISREGLQKLMQASGASYLAQQVALLEFETKSAGGTVAPAEVLMRKLEKEANDRLNPMEFVPGRTRRDEGTFVPRAATAEELRVGGNFRELTNALREVFANNPVRPVINVVNDAERPKPVPAARLGR